MLRIKFPTLLKALSGRVKPHLRAGKPVLGYQRAGKPVQGRKKRSIRLRATMPQMLEMGKVIEKNIAYLVFMGKEIARVHGLDIRFIDGQPVGDLADLISEGKHGMLIGGMEAIRSKKTGVQKLVQMKTRAKQRMRLMAKRLRGSGVQLPRDTIKQLAIISSATEKFMQANNGEKPTKEMLAEMIILHKRTRDGGSVELEYDEKVARIEALEGYKGAQLVDDMDTTPHVEEEDVRFWTIWSREERQLREITHEVINELVVDKKLTLDERDVLYLRFYVDRPQASRMHPRSFSTVAALLDKKRGIKKLKVRKTVGDNHRWRPFHKVRHMTSRKIPGKDKRRKTITYTRRQYKTPVSGVIVDVGTKSFVVEREGRKYRIQGKPPFREKSTGQMDVFRIYQSGIEKILAHPKATDELKQALALVQKSIRIIVLVRM